MDVLFHLLLCLMGLRLLCQLICHCGTCQLVSLPLLLLFQMMDFDFILVALMLFWLPQCCHGCLNVALCSLSADAPRLVNLLTQMLGAAMFWVFAATLLIAKNWSGAGIEPATSEFMSVALPTELILSLRSRFKCPARLFCRPWLRVSPLALRAVHTLYHTRFVRVNTPLHGWYSNPLFMSEPSLRYLCEI